MEISNLHFSFGRDFERSGVFAGRQNHLFYMHHDRELSEEIYEAIEKEEALSRTSKNIQVLVENGRVVLKGEVFLGEEKKIIEARAAEYAGIENVSNQLEVIEELE